MPQHTPDMALSPLPSYTVIRTQRRSIALVLRPNGTLEVRAPKRVSKAFIEAFIREKAAWIAQKKAKQKARPQQTPRTWQNGDTFYFMGTPYTLHINQGQKTHIERTKNNLVLHQKTPENIERVRYNLAQWYKKEALKAFSPRLNAYAHQMGAHMPTLLITNAKQQWGSCQGQKRVVRLSLKLLMAEQDVQDYVLIHELAHLKHMNHSKDFWNHVANFCPNWKDLQQKLHHHANLWRFD